MKRLALDYSCSCWKLFQLTAILGRTCSSYKFCNFISVQLRSLFYKRSLTKRFICGKIVVRFKVKVFEVIVHRKTISKIVHIPASMIYIYIIHPTGDEAVLNMRGIKCGNSKDINILGVIIGFTPYLFCEYRRSLVPRQGEF